jgi:hypothetical protein
MKSSNTGANRKLLTKDDVSTRSFQMNTNHASLGPYTYFWLGGGVLKSVSTGTPDQIVDGNWHHVVSVFKSGEYIRMYIDGVQAGNTNVTETTLDSSTANFLIGSNGWSGTVGIDGNVDEVAIWNSALTQATSTNISSLQQWLSCRFNFIISSILVEIRGRCLFCFSKLHCSKPNYWSTKWYKPEYGSS